jgi:hypothetical protein
MAEMNPDNPLVASLREQWQKMCGLVMSKMDVREVRINSGDVDKLAKMFAPDFPAVVVQIENANSPNEELVIRLMDQMTAEKKMREFESRKN